MGLRPVPGRLLAASDHGPDAEGAAVAGIVAGALGGLALTRLADGYLQAIRLPGALPVLGAAVVLMAAAIQASLMPAARASRVDVLQALRSV